MAISSMDIGVPIKGGRLVNLTPHEIRIMRKDTPSVIKREDADKYTLAKIPPSGVIARIKTLVCERVGETLNIEGHEIPVATVSYIRGTLDDEDVIKLVTRDGKEVSIAVSGKDIWIVSTLVLLAIKKTPPFVMFVAPDTGGWGAVRDENGHIIGVRRLITKADIISAEEAHKRHFDSIVHKFPDGKEIMCEVV